MEEIKETNPVQETNDLQELLNRMERTSQQQLRFTKLQCLFSLISACLFAVVLIAVLSFLPKLNGIVGQVDTILNEVGQVSSQLAEADIAGVMSDLEDVTNQMANADLDGIARDVSSLVQTTQTSVEEAMSKINDMDLETLNQAISDLAAVMKPLSTFFGKGK